MAQRPPCALVCTIEHSLAPCPKVGGHVERFDNAKDALTHWVFRIASSGEPNVKALCIEVARMLAKKPCIHSKGHPVVRHTRLGREFVVAGQESKGSDCANCSGPLELCVHLACHL
eukprot:scaffold8363_cov32-Tisochrysis_lutea.AAC.2